MKPLALTRRQIEDLRIKIASRRLLLEIVVEADDEEEVLGLLKEIQELHRQRIGVEP